MSIIVKRKGNFFEKYSSATQQKIENIITQGSLKIEASAKTNCPVDTGNLRASIHTEITKDGEGISGQIGTNVEYANFVEFGTKKKGARPFLFPALKEHQEDIKSQVQQALGGR